MLRLNLGAADWQPEGFVPVDIAGANPVDLCVHPWPWADGAVDEILASHILEHFDRCEGQRFLEECRRVLPRGGRLRLAVPDLDKFIDCRLAGDYAPLGGYEWTSLDWLGGGDLRETRPGWRHRYFYTWENLQAKLYHAGFDWVVRRGEPGAYDNPAYAAISLYVDAIR